MKNVILSADGDLKVYSVPDIVADNLEKYCIEFRHEWMQTNPNARKYFLEKYGVFAFDESDFIEYLNIWIFPDVPSSFVENIEQFYYNREELPEAYKDCPWFNF